MIIFNLTEENGLNSLNDFYGIDDSFNSNDYFVSNLTEAIACENSSKPIGKKIESFNLTHFIEQN